MLATFTVNSFMDNGDGANTTLREAIVQANANPGHDTITFDPTVFNTPKTIQLTEGQLHISDSVQIEGLGPNRLIVKADDPDGVAGNFDDPSSRDGHRIFLILRSPTANLYSLFDNTPEIDVTISGLTLTGGEVAWMPGDPNPGQPGSPDFRFEGGGAILNYENLTLVNSVISNSHAQNGGGAMTTQLVNGVAAADSTKFCAIWSLAA
jgi:CSLREA domain-containing protein